MRCENCNSILEEKEIYCSTCGTRVRNNTNESLVRAYIGEEYDKLKIDKFNLKACLFPIYSLAYRKQFAYALCVLLLLVTSISISLAAPILIKIIIGLNYNKMYLWIIKRKVKSIKQESKNEDELLAEIRRQSGRSLGLVFLMLLIIISLIMLRAIVTNLNVLLPLLREDITLRQAFPNLLVWLSTIIYKLLILL